MMRKPIEGKKIFALHDGSKAIVRPICPEDALRLQALFDRLSPETIYRRFHHPVKQLSDDLAHEFSNVDGRTRMAFVATLEDEQSDLVIAVARYAMIPPQDAGTAEVAIVVEDKHQGKGLGTVLLKRLVIYARAHGIRTFLGIFQHDNLRIMQLIKHSGFPYKNVLRSGVMESQINLEALHSGL